MARVNGAGGLLPRRRLATVGRVSVTWIDLAGAHNVRDLGGLRAGAGTTRPNVLLRADALDGLTAARRRRARRDPRPRPRRRPALGPRAPRARPRAARRDAGPLHGAGGDRPRRPGPACRDPRRLRSRPGCRRRRSSATGTSSCSSSAARRSATAFRRIVEPGGAPALVHCAIGKDRTGVLVALLLDAAGVDHDEIVADYARSGERMAPIIERWMTNNPSSTMTEQLAAFTAMAPAETMVQVLDHLATRWGGAAGFLADHGVSDAEVATWREVLVAGSRVEPRRSVAWPAGARRGLCSA